MEGVLEVKNEHFWSSGFNQIAGSLQVRVSRNTNEQKVLAMIVLKLFPVVPKCSVQVIHSVICPYWLILEIASKNICEMFLSDDSDRFYGKSPIFSKFQFSGHQPDQFRENSSKRIS